MKKLTYKIALVTAIAGVFTFSSCKDDPAPTPEPEQEEFDAVRIDMIKLDAGGAQTTDTVTVNFDRAGNPTPGTAALSSSTAYRTLLTLSQNGTSINGEITEEGTEHKFFFIPTVASGITNYEYKDADTDGNGIGLDGKMTIGTGTFDLKIVLRHALDKSKAEAQAWNSTNYQAAGGEDDLNINFKIEAQ